MKWLDARLTAENRRFVVALLLIALFGGAAVVLSFRDIPEGNREIIAQVVAGLNTLTGAVVGWYFSARKGDTGTEPGA
jgi:hypothetical protein